MKKNKKNQKQNKPIQNHAYLVYGSFEHCPENLHYFIAEKDWMGNWVDYVTGDTLSGVTYVEALYDENLIEKRRIITKEHIDRVHQTELTENKKMELWEEMKESAFKLKKPIKLVIEE